MGQSARNPLRAFVRRQRKKRHVLSLSALMAGIASSTLAAAEVSNAALETASSWNTASSGLRETGMAAIPLSKKRLCRDIIVTSGNDIVPQPIVAYRNQSSLNRSAFMQSLPDFISQSTGFYGPLAVGRLDTDEYPDVVVARYLSQPPLNRGACTLFRVGSVDVLWGGPCQPGADSTCGFVGSNEDQLGFAPVHHQSPNPGQLVPDALWPAGVALGDLDGDGDLDLAVAEPFRVAGDGLFRMAQLGSLASSTTLRDDCGHDVNPIYPGQVRLYCNHRGHFSACPGWNPPEMFAASVMLSDVDRDGLLDLVVGSDRIYVYFGERSASGAIALQPAPQWTSRTTASESSADSMSAQYMGLAANWLDTKDCNGGPCNGLTIAAAVGCPLLAEGGGSQTIWSKAACPGRIELYRSPSRGSEDRAPLWTSRWRGSANQVALADLDGDNVAEVVFDGWWEIDTVSGSLIDGVRTRAAKLRPSNTHDRALATGLEFDEDYFVATERVIGEAIVTSDFNGYSWVASQNEFRGVSHLPNWVLTLASINLEAVAKLERRRGQGAWSFMPLDAYHVSAHGNSIQLRQPLVEGETIRVTFTESRAADVAVATWDPDKGILLYKNKLSRESLYNNGEVDCFGPPAL